MANLLIIIMCYYSLLNCLSKQLLGAALLQKDHNFLCVFNFLFFFSRRRPFLLKLNIVIKSCNVVIYMEVW